MNSERLVWRAALAVLVLAAAARGAPQAADAEVRGAVRAEAVGRAYAAIRERGARELVERLAGPEMEGRRAASRGERKAAEVIAEAFEAAGLRGAGPEGSFLVPFGVNAVVADEERCVLEIHRGEDSRRLALGEDFLPVIGSAGSEVRGEVVFVGYGIRAPEHNWDDYASGHVRGRVALALWREPRHGRDGPLFRGRETTDHSSIRSKAAAAAAAGALALLVAPDPVHTGEEGPLGHQLPWAVGREGLRWALGTYTPSIPILTVGAAVAEEILGERLRPLQDAIDRTGRPRAWRPVQGLEVTVAGGTTTRQVQAHNVVGILDGEDPELRGEYVLLGAHYDHEGTDDAGRIYAGADDNASGTTALILAARAMAEAELRARRSVVFAAFSGEERGLLGSDALARAPPFPLEDVVAMLNLDMVGRARNRRVHVLGAMHSPELEAVVRDVAAARPPRVRLDFDSGGALTREFWQRSDQWSFARRGVPALFVFTGTHPDYHQPGDTPDLIEAGYLAEVAKLAVGFAVAVGAREARPARLEPAGAR